MGVTDLLVLALIADAAQTAMAGEYTTVATRRSDPQWTAHCGDTDDADYLSELAESGYLLGMDRFGLETVAPFEQRVEIVAEPCRRGFAGTMGLAHDTACYIDWAEPAAREWLPHWNYLHIHDEVLPALRERGVTGEQIDAMLVDNPARWIAAGR